MAASLANVEPGRAESAPPPREPRNEGSATPSPDSARLGPLSRLRRTLRGSLFDLFRRVLATDDGREMFANALRATGNDADAAAVAEVDGGRIRAWGLSRRKRHARNGSGPN